MDKVEIPLSKTKLFLGIAGSILFVIAGFILFLLNEKLHTGLDPVFVKGVAIGCTLFFVATGIYGIKKMFDKTIGLIIDENGIYDNTNASSVGLIKWSDITSIKTEKISSTKFLMIYTKDPESYINRAKGFKKKLMEGNNKLYGTPLSITSNTLKCKFSDLEKLINDRFNEQ